MFKILDMFCGIGGSSMGLFQACKDNNINASIIGVDIFDMPDYQFKFIKDDIFNYIEYTDLNSFNFIWASPPCQRYSVCKNIKDLTMYGDFCVDIHNILESSGIPYVIENVPQAPIRKDLLLCGEMFNMRIIRHRIFELGTFKIEQPIHKKHKPKGYYTTVAGHMAGIRKYKEVMEIDWSNNWKQLAEAVPPRYARFILNKYFGR
jgi:DNA (cytosine-5)-methyltransferase 1